GTTLEVETATWLAKRADKFYDKLVRVGLAKERAEKPTVLLGAFIDEFISKRSDVKGTTAKVFERCKKHLIEYFGAKKPLSQITVGDGKDWKIWLADKQKLSKNTIGRTCG